MLLVVSVMLASWPCQGGPIVIASKPAFNNGHLSNNSPLSPGSNALLSTSFQSASQTRWSTKPASTTPRNTLRQQALPPLSNVGTRALKQLETSMKRLITGELVSLDAQVDKFVDVFLPAQGIKRSNKARENLRIVLKELLKEAIQEGLDYATEALRDFIVNYLLSPGSSSPPAVQVLSVPSTDDTIPNCTRDDLSMLDTANADVKACTKYASYNLMSGLWPSVEQSTRLCGSGCSDLLNRLTGEPIPYCLVMFDGETIDVMGALAMMFWDCTEIVDVEMEGVEEEATLSASSRATSTDTSLTNSPRSDSSRGTVTTTPVTTTPVTTVPATSAPVTMRTTLVPTSGAVSSSSHMQVVPLAVLVVLAVAMS